MHGHNLPHTNLYTSIIPAQRGNENGCGTWRFPPFNRRAFIKQRPLLWFNRNPAR